LLFALVLSQRGIDLVRPTLNPAQVLAIVGSGSIGIERLHLTKMRAVASSSFSSDK
jgi:hypothetical protein